MNKLTSELFSKVTPGKILYDSTNLQLKEVPTLSKTGSYPFPTYKYIAYIQSIKTAIKKVISSNKNPSDYIHLFEKLFNGFFEDLEKDLERYKDQKRSNEYYFDNLGANFDDVCPIVEIVLSSMMIIPIYINNIEDHSDIYDRMCNIIDVNCLNIITKYQAYFDINYELKGKQNLISIMINHNVVKTLQYCLKNLPVSLDKELCEKISSKINTLKTIDKDKLGYYNEHLLQEFEELYSIYNNSCFMSNKIYETYMINKDLKTEVGNLKKQLENTEKVIDDIEIIDEKL
uniref:Uncharacterized protein n=1 Tax=viral metagenome TaxID=1070528 RepID=A0A6C0EAM6_9ZZZZ